MLDKCLLLLVFHTAGKIPWVEKSLGRQCTSKKIFCGCCTSMHIFRAVPRYRIDLGKMHLWGTWLCSGGPEVPIKWWGRAGLVFAAYKWPEILFTDNLPRKTHLLLKGFFGALEATCQKASQQLCGIIHAGTLLSSKLGPAPCPTSMWAGGIPGVCLLSASQWGQHVWGSLCLLQTVGQLGIGTHVHWRTGRQWDLPCLCLG